MKQLLLFVSLLPATLLAQDRHLDSLMGTTQPAHGRAYVTGTFKGTRIINLQSVEKAAPGTLQFLIQHRFGAVNGGGYEFFGLDQATIRLALEYGLHRAVAIGVGRSSYEKNYDAYTKVTLLRQAPSAVPFTLAYFGSVVYRGERMALKGFNSGNARLSYTHQLLLARKFTDRLSLQLAPTFVHKNRVLSRLDPNDYYALGVGGRYRLTKRFSLNTEYIGRLPPANRSAPAYADFHNSFSLGVDIETGGHVFQLHLTNSLSMLEKGFITESSESWGNGGVHFGFNISRDFTFGRGKKSKKTW
ncbi:DUF5777 family beta-barrel protein [Flaviaesturariibacter amylovorans]|uniref:DUF5777 family beta-barrel protein n=1 Tax=Flaviaesturariibacter amylovorans TaxID=1084520 RepID=A0ABP8GN98_9BACT